MHRAAAERDDTTTNVDVCSVLNAYSFCHLSALARQERGNRLSTRFSLQVATMSDTRKCRWGGGEIDRRGRNWEELTVLGRREDCHTEVTLTCFSMYQAIMGHPALHDAGCHPSLAETYFSCLSVTSRVYVLFI